LRARRRARCTTVVNRDAAHAEGWVAAGGARLRPGGPRASDPSPCARCAPAVSVTERTGPVDGRRSRSTVTCARDRGPHAPPRRFLKAHGRGIVRGRSPRPLFLGKRAEPAADRGDGGRTAPKRDRRTRFLPAPPPLEARGLAPECARQSRRKPPAPAACQGRRGGAGLPSGRRGAPWWGKTTSHSGLTLGHVGRQNDGPAKASPPLETNWHVCSRSGFTPPGTKAGLAVIQRLNSLGPKKGPVV